MGEHQIARFGENCRQSPERLLYSAQPYSSGRNRRASRGPIVVGPIRLERYCSESSAPDSSSKLLSSGLLIPGMMAKSSGDIVAISTGLTQLGNAFPGRTRRRWPSLLASNALPAGLSSMPAAAAPAPGTAPAPSPMPPAPSPSPISKIVPPVAPSFSASLVDFGN